MFSSDLFIETFSLFYERDNANLHLGLHSLSNRATEAYEGARARVAKFVNAADPAEVVFTRGTTESINLVAQSWGRRNLRAGDEVILTWLEHHSNIVPWQLLCQETGLGREWVREPRRVLAGAERGQVLGIIRAALETRPA